MKGKFLLSSIMLIILLATAGTINAQTDSGTPPPVYGSGTLNYIPLFTGTSTIGNSVIFQKQIGDGLIVPLDYYIGVSTTNPDTKLHVTGSIGNNWITKMVNSSITGKGLLVVGGNSENNYSVLELQNNDGNSLFKVQSNNISVFNGKVGIGTTNPISKLQVQGELRITNGSDPNTYISTMHDGASFLIDHHGNGRVLYEYYTPGKFIGFCSDTTETSKYTFLALNGGTVGIGTPTPYAKLQVVGNSVFTGTTGSITTAAYIKGLNTYSTATTPDYTWYNYDQTGIFHTTGDDIGFTIGGAEKMRIAANGNIGIGITDNLHAKLDINAGNSTGLYINTQQDSDYGYCIKAKVNRDNTKALSILKDGTENFVVYGNGNVGIGTNNPDDQLHITKDIQTLSGTVGIRISSSQFPWFIGLNHSLSDVNLTFANGNDKNNPNMVLTSDGGTKFSSGISKLGIGSANNPTLYGTSYVGFNAYRDGSISSWIIDGNNSAHNGGSLIYGTKNGDMSFVTVPSTSGSAQTLTDQNILDHLAMTIKQNGNVGIGTPAPGDYKLAVAGKIHCTEVVVEATPWPDYVFDKGYKLMPVKELEQYVTANKHLPGIPDAQTVSEKGVSVGEMNAQLLKKVEELTQYIIQQQKEIDQLKDTVNSLK